MMTDIIATESTEKHGIKKHPSGVFPCLSVDSVAMERK
jgi:hypothetical protein